MAVTINGTTGIETNTDTGKVKVGASDDLQLYHYSDNSYIENSTGHLIINSSATTNVDIMKAGHSEYLARFKPDGAVELYYDNSKKLNTYASGITVTGHVDVLSGSVYLEDNGKAIFGTGSDLQIYHNGTDSFISNTTDTDLIIRNIGNAGIDIKPQNSYPVNLYYNDTKTFQTTSDGAKVQINTSEPRLRVHADTNTNARPGIELIRGATDSYGGDNYDDWSIVNYDSILTIYNASSTNGNVSRITISSNGTLTGELTDTSDEKKKKNITAIPDGAIANIKQLRPVTFNWKDPKNTDEKSGFIAQEVKTVIPNLVVGEEYDESKEGLGYAISTPGVVAHLTKALQEAIAKIETLETKVAALEAA